HRGAPVLRVGLRQPQSSQTGGLPLSTHPTPAAAGSFNPLRESPSEELGINSRASSQAMNRTGRDPSQTPISHPRRYNVPRDRRLYVDEDPAGCERREHLLPSGPAISAVRHRQDQPVEFAQLLERDER